MPETLSLNDAYKAAPETLSLNEAYQALDPKTHVDINDPRLAQLAANPTGIPVNAKLNALGNAVTDHPAQIIPGVVEAIAGGVGQMGETAVSGLVGINEGIGAAKQALAEGKNPINAGMTAADSAIQSTQSFLSKNDQVAPQTEVGKAGLDVTMLPLDAIKAASDAVREKYGDTAGTATDIALNVGLLGLPFAKGALDARRLVKASDQVRASLKASGINPDVATAIQAQADAHARKVGPQHPAIHIAEGIKAIKDDDLQKLSPGYAFHRNTSKLSESAAKAAFTADVTDVAKRVVPEDEYVETEQESELPSSESAAQPGPSPPIGADSEPMTLFGLAEKQIADLQARAGSAKSQAARKLFQTQAAAAQEAHGLMQDADDATRAGDLKNSAKLLEVRKALLDKHGLTDPMSTPRPLPDADTADPDTSSSNQEPSVHGEQSASPLTPEALALLKNVDLFGLPYKVSSKLRQIAQENGIKITDQTSPEDVIGQLRKKQPVEKNPAAPPVEAPGKPQDATEQAAATETPIASDNPQEAMSESGDAGSRKPPTIGQENSDKSGGKPPAPPPGFNVNKSIGLGGGKSLNGKTGYISRMIPQFVDVPTRSGGTARIPVWDEIASHENREQPNIAAKGYDKAHNEDGNAATAAFLEPYDVDPRAYQNVLRPHLKAAELDALQHPDNVPADLDHRVYAKPWADTDTTHLLGEQHPWNRLHAGKKPIADRAKARETALKEHTDAADSNAAKSASDGVQGEHPVPGPEAAVGSGETAQRDSDAAKEAEGVGDASQDGNEQGNGQQQHQGTGEQRPAAKTGGSDSAGAKTQGAGKKRDLDSPKLPKELAGAKPRYNMGLVNYLPKFESDIDKAAFITSQKKPSKSDAKYRQFLRDAGMSDSEIAAHGEKVRVALKNAAKAKPEGGDISIPEQERANATDKGTSGTGSAENSDGERPEKTVAPSVEGAVREEHSGGAGKGESKSTEAPKDDLSKMSDAKVRSYARGWGIKDAATRDPEALRQEIRDRRKPQAMRGDAAEPRSADEVRTALSKKFGAEGISNMEKSGKLTITDSDSLPDHLKELASDPSVKSIHDPASGKSYLLHDRLAPGEEADALTHEVGSHYGMADMLGQKGELQFLNNVRLLRGTSDAVKAAWQHVRENYPHLDENSHDFLREVAAKVAETSHSMPIIQRMFAKMKSWLYKKGFTKGFSDSTIRGLAADALRKAGRDSSETTTFNRSPLAMKRSGESGLAHRIGETRGTEAERGDADSKEESVAHGNKMLDAGTDPHKIIADAIKGKTDASDAFDVAAAHIVRLEKITNEAADQHGLNSPQYKQAHAAEEAWRAEVKPLQTKWSEQGLAQQGSEADVSTVHGLQREFSRTTGKTFTPKQAEEAVDKAGKVKDAEAEVKAVQEKLAKTLGNKKIPDDVLKDFKPGSIWTPQQAKALWAAAKKNYFDKGVNSFDDIRHGLSSDYNIPIADVTRGLAMSKTMRAITDDMYAKMAARRKVINQAKTWVTEQKYPGYEKAFRGIPNAFFNLATALHGTVWVGTHAESRAFNPLYAKQVWKDWGEGIKFMLNSGYHEQMMADQVRDPNFIKAKRAGLDNDPFTYKGEYQNKGAEKLFGKIGEAGNRGFDGLKLLRQHQFNKAWSSLSPEMRTDDMAKALATQINHATGYTQANIPSVMQSVFFAPRLELSKWRYLFSDSYRSAKTLMDPKNSTPEERHAARTDLRDKLVLAGTAYALLGINAGYLQATGSDQKVNFLDPRKPDFMALKGDDKQFAPLGPLTSIIKFVSNVLSYPFAEKGDPSEKTFDRIGKYARGKLSPSLGIIADAFFGSDYEKRPMPWSDRKVPKYLQEKGITEPYSYAEYASEHLLPIFIEDAARQAWDGQAADKPTQDLWMNALTSGIASGLAGARVTEDRGDKK